MLSLMCVICVDLPPRFASRGSACTLGRRPPDPNTRGAQLQARVASWGQMCSTEHMTDGTGEGDGEDARSLGGENAEDMVVMAQVARRHYVGGQSKVRIAQDLDLSRFKVARLIRASLETGIVRFEISTVDHINLGLSVRLKDEFDLNQCLVVDTPDESEETLRSYVGMTMTKMLADTIDDTDILGLSATRALVGLENSPSKFAKCPVVQMTGAFSRLDAADVMEGIRRLTRVGGGPAYLYYAPMICRERFDAEYVERQDDYLRCQNKYKDISVAGVGIGAWRDGLSQVYDAVDANERSRIRSLGVQAELCGMLLDEQGNTLSVELNDRMVGISSAEFMMIPKRIGVVFGLRKSQAVRIALNARIINGLVTHRTLAEQILQL